MLHLRIIKIIHCNGILLQIINNNQEDLILVLPPFR